MEFLPSGPLQVNTLVLFGFLLFCGALGGYLAPRVSWIPSITGFMLVGLVAGPNVLGLFDHASLEQARVVVDIALALILYRLGLSLDVRTLLQDRALLAVSLIESGLTFAAVLAGLIWYGLAPLPAAVMAAIAISSSPAVLLHVAHELGAHGPATDRARALVAMNNVLAFAMFAALLPALYHESAAPLLTMAGAPVYQLLGSALLGGLTGLALHHVARLTRGAAQYSLALVVGWPRASQRHVGLMLWPMAGMAIGLANTTAATFPLTGAEVAAVVLAAVAVFETIGPPVVARALRWAGEVPADTASDWPVSQAHAALPPEGRDG